MGEKSLVYGKMLWLAAHQGPLCPAVVWQGQRAMGWMQPGWRRLGVPVPCRGAEQGTQTPVTSPRVPKLPCSLSTMLRSTVDLCHGTSTCRTCIRCWGMLELAGRGKWVLGDQCGWHVCSGAIYGCRAVPPSPHNLLLPCVSHVWGAALMPEWAPAQRCCPTGVPGPAQRECGVGALSSSRLLPWERGH